MVATRFEQKLAKMVKLEDSDLDVIRRLEVQPRRLKRGQDIIRDGDRPDAVHLVQSGLACRYKIIGDGRRQITAFLLPGDACDLHIFILNAMDHGIGVLSEAEVIDFPKAAMEELLDHPRIARALLKSVLIDEATLRQWIVNVAKRSAAEAIAHLFCELHLRMSLVGLAPKGDFALPITQDDLGDTVGPSTVHVNRSLQELKAKGLVDFRSHEVTIPDVERLRRYAGFDASYLHLGR